MEAGTASEIEENKDRARRVIAALNERDTAAVDTRREPPSRTEPPTGAAGSEPLK